MEDTPSPKRPDDLSPRPQSDTDDAFVLAVGSTAIEKLCIAIINGHPNRDPKSSLTPQQRVRDAVFALQGHNAERGSNKKDDLQLLLQMAEALNAQVRAEEIQKQFAGPVELLNFRRQRLTEIASDTEERHALARLALRKFGIEKSKANLKRLTSKFGNEWPLLLHTLGMADPVPHSNENRCMSEIVPLLVQMGIPAKLPNETDMFWPTPSDK